MLENVAIVLVFVAVRFFLVIHDAEFDIQNADSSRIHEAISQSKLIPLPIPADSSKGQRQCPFAISPQIGHTGREFVAVSGVSDTATFWREKLHSTISTDPYAMMNWVLDQISMRHLFRDVVIHKYFWIFIGLTVLASLLVRVFILDPFIKQKGVDESVSQEFREADRLVNQGRLSQFLIEKALIVGIVIIRHPYPPPPTDLTRMHDYYFGARFTDATVFALWYIIVWSVQSTTLSLHSRFELLVCTTAKEGRVIVPVGILSLLFSVFCASAIMTSTATTSFQLLHPVYSLLLLSEAFGLLVRAMYVSFRVAQYHHGACDQAAQRKLAVVKMMSDTMIDAAYTLEYILLVCVGMLLHGRVLSLVFVPRITSHLHAFIANMRKLGSADAVPTRLTH